LIQSIFGKSNNDVLDQEEFKVQNDDIARKVDEKILENETKLESISEQEHLDTNTNNPEQHFDVNNPSDNSRQGNVYNNQNFEGYQNQNYSQPNNNFYSNQPYPSYGNVGQFGDLNQPFPAPNNFQNINNPTVNNMQNYYPKNNESNPNYLSKKEESYNRNDAPVSIKSSDP
jgi:hypothetical protein